MLFALSIVASTLSPGAALSGFEPPPLIVPAFGTPNDPAAPPAEPPAPEAPPGKPSAPPPADPPAAAPPAPEAPPAGAPPAAAAPKVTGVWQCQIANQSVRGNPTENWIYDFKMTVAEGGKFEASGTYTSGIHGFNETFTAAGDWQADAKAFGANGPAQLSYSGPRQFTVYAEFMGPGNMTYRYNSAGGNMLVGCKQ